MSSRNAVLDTLADLDQYSSYYADAESCLHHEFTYLAVVVSFGTDSACVPREALSDLLTDVVDTTTSRA